MEYWSNSTVFGFFGFGEDLSFWFVSYSFQSEIRNSKSEITLAPLLQQIFGIKDPDLENYPLSAAQSQSRGP